MAAIPTGYSLITWTGATTTLSTASWKNNVSGVFKVNTGRNALISFKPASQFNNVTQVVTGGVYLLTVTTGFSLAEAVLTVSGFQAGGTTTLPTGLNLVIWRGATTTLSTSAPSWRASVGGGIFKVNVGRNGLISYKPASSFNNVTQLDTGAMYLFAVTTQLALADAVLVFTPATAGAPTITSFTPTSAQEGSTVTITGTNLTGATVVSFNGATAQIPTNTATSIGTFVPTGATSGPITVTTPGGTVTSSGSFTVTTVGSGGLVTTQLTNGLFFDNITNVTEGDHARHNEYSSVKFAAPADGAAEVEVYRNQVTSDMLATVVVRQNGTFFTSFLPANNSARTFYPVSGLTPGAVVEVFTGMQEFAGAAWTGIHLTAIRTSTATTFFTPTTPDRLVIGYGDSIFSGAYCQDPAVNGWGTQLRAMLPAGTRLTMEGASSRSLSNDVPNAADPSAFGQHLAQGFGTAVQKLFLSAIGVNDILRSSPAEFGARYAALVDWLYTNVFGIRIVLLTQLPVTLPALAGSVEEYRQQIRNLKTGRPTLEVYEPGDWMGVNDLYSDELHLNLTPAHTKMAQGVFNHVFSRIYELDLTNNSGGTPGIWNPASNYPASGIGEYDGAGYSLYTNQAGNLVYTFLNASRIELHTSAYPSLPQHYQVKLDGGAAENIDTVYDPAVGDGICEPCLKRWQAPTGLTKGTHTVEVISLAGQYCFVDRAITDGTLQLP